MKDHVCRTPFLIWLYREGHIYQCRCGLRWYRRREMWKEIPHHRRA